MEHDLPSTIEEEKLEELEIAAVDPVVKKPKVTAPLSMSEEQEVPGDQPLLEKEEHKSNKKRGVKVIYVLLCVLLLLGTGSSLASFFGYRTYQSYNADYHRYLSLAQVGIQHLQVAEKLLAAYPRNPLDEQSVIRASKEFSSALNNFVVLDNGLKSLPALSRYIPGYGAKLHAALDLLPLAIEVSQAGILGCNILNLVISKFHDPLSVNGHGLTTADFATIKDKFGQIEGILYHAIDQIHHLSPSDVQLDPRVSKLLTAFHQYLPAMLSSLDDVEKLLTVIPTLLGIGTRANYLVEILDSTELRPGGGFIGNYGILTLVNGRLADAHITDVDLLDRPFEAAGHVIPYPPAYSWFDIAPESWSLRDANLDADFPTVARYSEQNYQLEGGRVPFQGVIAFTPVLIQHVLEITGPIKVPEYHETVTAQNLIDRIHYHQLVASEGVDTVASADGHSSQRKRFTELLAEHFLTRVHQLGSAFLPKFTQVMLTGLHTKDLQIYLNSSIAESFLQRYHVDAAIESPPGDSLFVVDANIGVNKANPFIINTLDDGVSIDAQGNVTHRTTLTYAWTIPGPSYGGSPVYRDYVRIYVPPGSILHRQDGWEPRGTSKAFGRTVWAGFFTLTFGQTQSIVLQWTVPKAATQDAKGWHYQYLLQRQAGTRWTMHLHLTLPSCAAVLHTSGVLVYSKKNKQLSIPAHSLSQDTNMGVDYTCQ